MGLTHYWERPTELPAEAFALAAKDVERAMSLLRVDIAGFDGSGSPKFSSDLVVFHGVAPACCEPFEMHQTEFDRRGGTVVFGYAKTEGLPYDLAVRVALIVFKQHLGDSIKVTSDDKTETAWQQARSEVLRYLGYGDRFRLDDIIGSA